MVDKTKQTVLCLRAGPVPIGTKMTRRWRPSFIPAALLFVLFSFSQGFYLPGVAPKAFKDGDPVKMKVQTLVSTETPLQVRLALNGFERPLRDDCVLALIMLIFSSSITISFLSALQTLSKICQKISERPLQARKHTRLHISLT